MADEYTEILVAIGRVEEGMRHMREDIAGLRTEFQVHRQEVEAVKQDIRIIELDLQEVKTRHNSNRANAAVIVSVLAVVIAAVNVLSGIFA